MTTLQELNNVAGLHELLALSKDVAAKRGIGMEAVMVHALACAGALIGHLVVLPENVGKMSSFRLLLKTPDPSLPVWLNQEWQALEEQQQSPINLLHDPKLLRQLRRRLEVMARIGVERSLETLMFEGILTASRSYRELGRVMIIDGRRMPKGTPGLPMTCLAVGPKNIGKIASHAESNPADLGMIGWVRDCDATALVRQTGYQNFKNLGFIVECQGTLHMPDCVHQIPGVVPAVVRVLQTARFGPSGYRFVPNKDGRDVLDRQGEHVRAMAAALPGCIRDQAIPDPNLAWYLSAILAAVIAAGPGRTNPQAVFAASCLGAALASWCMHHHLHRFLRTFPADDAGLFDGLDLRVVRLLCAAPGTVRHLQRRLRGVDKASCLRSLHRAVHAGLVMVSPGDLYAVTCPPVVTLSDLLSDQEAMLDFRSSPGSCSTDSTDNSDPSRSPGRP